MNSPQLEMETAENTPKVKVTKKMQSEYDKSYRRAERERARMLKEYEQELELKRKREERDKKLLEKKNKKDEEERLKEERRLKKIDEQRKRDEEKETDRVRKEDERRQKEEERRQKEEERRQKEEERRQKEDERVQKDLERKKEETFKTKREEKQRAVLLGFLVRGDQKKLRKDMRMAPLHRVTQTILASKRVRLDALLNSWASANSTRGTDAASSLGLTKFGRTNYLHELRTGQRIPLSCPSTWPTEPLDLQFLDEDLYSTVNTPALRFHGCRGPGGTVRLRAKLLQFVENYRPAYYGTWRRQSRVVYGRRPMAHDNGQLDYSVDSDEEWEEEEPGESITQSDNEEEEKEEEEEDDDEDEDDQFFVPHGYLSDDEGVANEEGTDLPEAEDAKMEDMKKKLRQNLSVAEYEAAHRRGLQRLKPLVLGPVWLPDPLEFGQPTDSCGGASAKDLEEDKENVENTAFYGSTAAECGAAMQIVRCALSIYRVYLWDEVVPIAFRLDQAVTPSTKRPKKELPEDAVPYLIHLIHQNSVGKQKLAFEFRVFWHRHTTGTMPECTQFAEYKRYNATLSGNTPRSSQLHTGPLLGGPSWDNLVLSQTMVLAKINEISVFEEGRLTVQPCVIRRFQSRLSVVLGLNELSTIPADAPDSELTSLTHRQNFISWEYLTDVFTYSRRATSKKRLSSTKQQQQQCQSDVPPSGVDTTNTEPLSHPVKATHSDDLLENSLRVVLTPLVVNGQQKQPLPVTPKSKDAVGPTINPIPVNPIVATDPGKTDASLPNTSRKRVTLESFFTPPPSQKRPRKPSTPSNRTALSKDADVIVID